MYTDTPTSILVFPDKHEPKLTPQHPFSKFSHVKTITYKPLFDTCGKQENIAGLFLNLGTCKLCLFNIADDIEESKNLADSMPEKAKELHKRLTDYLKAVDAEDVQTLRKSRRQQIVENIPKQEQMVKELRARLKSENKTESNELARAERYLKWLKEQTIFIDERSPSV